MDDTVTIARQDAIDAAALMRVRAGEYRNLASWWNRQPEGFDREQERDGEIRRVVTMAIELEETAMRIEAAARK